MQIICKVKKPSVSISSKLNVALVEAARSKSRPPRVTAAQLASVPVLGDWAQDVCPSTPPPELGLLGMRTLPCLGPLILMQARSRGSRAPSLKADVRQDGGRAVTGRVQRTVLEGLGTMRPWQGEGWSSASKLLLQGPPSP